jgi:hypothetical protein
MTPCRKAGVFAALILCTVKETPADTLKKNELFFVKTIDKYAKWV